MLSDRELFVQIIERDVLNLYENLAQQQALLNIPAVQNTVFKYADKVIEYATNMLFGVDGNGTVEEASEIARMVLNEKIEEYRKKIREQK
jgi:hypothetical protein